jgi:hypothetical protein
VKIALNVCPIDPTRKPPGNPHANFAKHLASDGICPEVFNRKQPEITAMFRLIGALLASFALMVASAVAAETPYRDPQGRFTVDVPANWVTNDPGVQQIALLMAGIDGEKLVGICVVGVHEMAETRSASQGDIDQTLVEAFDENFWKSTFQAAGGKDVVIESSGAREKDGRKIHQVVATMGQQTKDGFEQAKSKQEIHAIPGIIHVIACATKVERYDTALADFDAIFNSYEPQRGLVSQAPSNGRSVLTLYSGSNFEGTARVLAQDAPNVAKLGLAGPPASIAIAGFGQWEICEGVNFTGNCRLLAAAANSAPGQALRLGSARRQLGNDPRGAAGVVGTASGIALKTATDRVLKGR